ncbi:hypothetical protein FSARC_14620 [Fusarium sarcochroum]|uniref:Uncharacterized protein n=1 Tax=Fusarium sarcochroum TaxID=1208366 RepID=A0A8H4SRV8_9HYPO|nr:hypothetical protein FSARC_14620 [Fusarium sarcochroum]
MRENVQFHTSDNVTLRGWLYKPDSSEASLPYLIMAHGFSGVKEMGLDAFAESIISQVDIICLVYDNRGFGDSDTRPSQAKHEILPAEQMSDYSDAITYAQSRSDVIKDKIGVWGSSYSGGHALLKTSAHNLEKLRRVSNKHRHSVGFISFRQFTNIYNWSNKVVVIDYIWLEKPKEAIFVEEDDHGDFPELLIYTYL